MTDDLAADGDRLYYATLYDPCEEDWRAFEEWTMTKWPAIRAEWDALRAQLAAAKADADRLAVASKALWKTIVVVKGSLTDPYPDDDRWSPWTRFIEGPRNGGPLKQLESALAAHAAVEAS